MRSRASLEMGGWAGNVMGLWIILVWISVPIGDKGAGGMRTACISP